MERSSGISKQSTMNFGIAEEIASGVSLAMDKAYEGDACLAQFPCHTCPFTVVRVE